MGKTHRYPLDTLVRAKDIIKDDGTREYLLNDIKESEID